MTHTLEWTPAESAPPISDVLRAQRLPGEDTITPRLRSLVDRALAMYAELAEPRAAFADITADAFGDVYRGEGHNSHETPLETIYPAADRLALFAATVGPRVTSRISALFDAHELAPGYMLDAVASLAADRLTDLVSDRYLALARGDENMSWRALAYSPGYCGWHVTGQHKLFEYLRPERIGITLNASSLMEPLKSVSGVLVVGPARIHQFRPTYSFCDECQEKQCRDRIGDPKRETTDGATD